MRIIKFITVVCIAVIFAECSQSPKCWGEDKNEGIIENNAEIFCFMDGQHVINSEQELKNLFDSTCVLPSIDFNAHTLLGLSTTFGCDAKFIREVKRNETENKYEYKVTVKECGACKRLGHATNWVLVPKLPSGWTVDFSVKKK